MAEQILPAAADTPLWRIRLRLLDDKVRSNWALFVQTKIGLIGLGIIVFYLLLVVAYPVLMNTVWSPAVYDPVIGFDHSQTSQPAPPSIKHPLGTDPLGRDVLSQLMASTRSEFMLGVFAALVTVIVATSVGAVSAYFGGVIDMLFMRLADLMIMMPIISLLVVLGGFHNIGLLELGLVIGVLSGFGTAAVVVKSQALGVKVNPYVEAARSAGGSHFHIITKHIVPSLLPLSFLYMMFTVTAAIFSEATLSYLGLLDTRTSWGLMIRTTQSAGYLLQLRDFWWLILPPSLSITLLCSAFYLVGRGLDEVVNPRLRRL
ncbi:MAG: ABC transporter permease [Chloroflexi bacterium]|nr:ABC transporter permease [Chloroflexota bacterium]